MGTGFREQQATVEQLSCSEFRDHDTWFYVVLYTCTQTFEHKTHICTHYTMSCFIFYEEGKEFSAVFFCFFVNHEFC